ncbi:hypothetical protein AB9F29_19270 [Falsihalocynthiibacter sp. S25ZX9]|uniref:hypothetical protein n=1 Tax=Falsihalocynthiibacter sp. S25ZX9 TaxID=3240870 RepID=UPI00350EEF95
MVTIDELKVVNPEIADETFAALYPFRPLAKVVVDLTPLRSSKNKRLTIQPPSQLSILKC